MRQGLAAVIALLSLAALAGCESTQDKAAKLAESGSDVFGDRGVVVTRQTREVRVGRPTVLTDDNGTAVVVPMRSRARRPLARLPVSIEVTDRRGEPVFSNDASGLETALAHAALLEPGEQFFWVHDQVQATGEPSAASARVGRARGRVMRRPPRLEVSGVRLEADFEGVAATGFVSNRSRVEQRRLVLFGVARKGRRIVAAGRAQVRRLKAGRRSRFTMFFIGDPRGARLTVSAPPVKLR